MQAVVLEVDGLVGAHRQCLADRLGGALRACGQEGDRAFAALFLLDQQRLFDGALVDLVQHGVGGAVPAIIAEYLGLPQLTHVRKLTVEGGKVTAERETDDGVFTLEASLPAIVSVNEKINEPRFPSFKGIMAAKKKEVTTLSLAEIGVEADEVGVANAGSTVLSSTPKPPKTAGEKIADEGEGGSKIAAYLVGQKLI